MNALIPGGWGNRAVLAENARRIAQRSLGYTLHRMLHTGAGYAYSAWRRGGRVTRSRRAYALARSTRRGRRLSLKANRRRVRRRIGEPIGATSARTHLSAEDGSTLGEIGQISKTLYNTEITTVSRGSNLEDRERDIINCRGFKIYFQMRNTSERPLWFHMAAVCPKLPGTSNTPVSFSTDDFFRVYGNDRSGAFNNAQSGFSQSYRPINTDRFNILMHKRMLVHTQDSTSGIFRQANKSQFRTFKIWLPLRRQLRYDGATATSPVQGKVYLVWWATEWDSAEGDVGVADAFRIKYNVYMYFRNSDK